MSAPTFNCAISSARTPSTSGSYCLAGSGHPRMDVCCERYGFSSEIQIQGQCHTWCVVNDNAFGENQSSDNGTRRGERLTIFNECLWNGPDGGEDFIQGPQLLDCTFNDLTGRVTANSSGQSNETDTSNAPALNFGSSVEHFLVVAGLISIGLM